MRAKRGDEEMRAVWAEIRRRDMALWLDDHPGMTARDYRRVEDTEEVREWRGKRNAPILAAKRRAWEREHPGRPYPEHECGMSERQHAAFARWERAYNRRAGIRGLDELAREVISRVRRRRRGGKPRRRGGRGAATRHLSAQEGE